MLPFAQRQLEKMMAARRDRLWGPIDDIKARIRRHPKSGEEVSDDDGADGHANVPNAHHIH